MRANIFFDFNGTILDDVDLCHQLLNDVLKKQSKKLLSIDEYKDVFGFPISEYYEKAGVDFSINSYESLAKEYMEKYIPLSLSCKLYPGLIDCLDELSKKSDLYITSASNEAILLKQCELLGITKYFKKIMGQKDIYAKGKIENTKEYIKNNNIDKNCSYLIGDTTHDYEVAIEIGLKPILVSYGHESIERLSRLDCDILDSCNEIIHYFNNL